MTSAIYDETMFQELSSQEIMSVDGGRLSNAAIYSLAYAIVFVGFAPAMAIAAGFGLSLGAIGTALGAAGAVSTVWGAIDILRSYGI